MNRIAKYIGEALVIVFSVLIAFWVDEYRDDKKEEEDVEKALIALRSEIDENYKRLEENQEFFLEMSEAVYLFIYHRNDSGEVEVTRNIADSLDLGARKKYTLNLIECQANICRYEFYVNFGKIPDIPIRDNIWVSINSSQTARDIDIEIMGAAANFYNSWSHKSIEEIITEYNLTFIGSEGNLDNIPSYELFARLNTLHNLSLATYKKSLAEFNSKLNEATGNH